MRKIYALLLTTAFFVSCSGDADAPPVDPVESISMKVNGVTRTFNPQGRGINLQANGTYKLDLQMYTNDSESEPGYITLEMRYKKKGTNVIEEFHCFANPNGMDANLVGPNFQNKVTVNSRKQFTATFSGSMQNGSEVVTITDGYINFIYDDPFDSRQSNIQLRD